MASNVDPVGEPIPTSAVLMASSKHISSRCLPENVVFLKCKKKDANPEKCLDKGQEVTRCVLGLPRGPRRRVSLGSMPAVENYSNPKTCFFNVFFKAGSLPFYTLCHVF